MDARIKSGHDDVREGALAGDARNESAHDDVGV